MASTGKTSKVKYRKCTGLGHYARECPTDRVMVALEDGGYDSASDYDEDTLALLAHEEQQAAAPTAKDSQYMSVEATEQYPTLVAQRVLSVQLTQAEPNQCHNLFHTKGVVKDRCVRIIIDGRSCNNLASLEMVEKLSITTRPHPRPYYIQWFNNSDKVKVTRSVRVHFLLLYMMIMLSVMLFLCKHAPFYLVDHGNLIEILYTMVQQISILLFIMINQLCYYLCL
jgi:hypothetical protein